MKYMGSKARISKYILPVILKDRKPGQWYVEPMVGGGNMIDKVDGNRIGADINEYLIEALKLIRDNPESLPDLITEDEYDKYKTSSNKALRGYVGFAMSFGGKWFSGYRRDKAGTSGDIENMKAQSRRSKNSAILQSSKIQGVKLICSSYDQLDIPANSIVYCDIPYQDTTRYRTDFDHDAFWKWCRARVRQGHNVFVSEYSAPDDFVCIWEKEVSTTLDKSGSKKDTERLFIHQSQYKPPDEKLVLNQLFS